MAIDLNKQIGPFPLKVWLIIGAGGIGVGLYVASKQNSGTGVTSNKGIEQPPQVFFSKVTIGLEHVPGIDDVVKPIVPTKVNPIMPSNPAATPSPHLPIPIPPTTSQGLAPIHTSYTAVAPTIWSAFTAGIPITPALVAQANQQKSVEPFIPKLDASGNAYF